MRRVADVEQQAESRARAAREADLGIDGDVVALIRTGRRPGVAATASAARCSWRTRRTRRARRTRRTSRGRRRRGRARLTLARLDCVTIGIARRHRQAVEDARRADNRRLLRRGKRNLDHFQPESRRVRIVDPAFLAAREFLRRPNACGARHVDVDVVVVSWLRHDRVRMRSAAGLHARHERRVLDVGDVEHTDAAHARLAHGLGHAAEAAVGSADVRLGRHEQQVLVNRHVVLGCRAQVTLREHRFGRIRDVVDLESVVVALDRVLPFERQVRMRGAQRLPGRRRRRNHPHVPRGFAGVPPSGLEADAGIGRRRRGRDDRAHRLGHLLRRGRRRSRRRAATSASSARRGRSGSGRRRRRFRGRRGSGRC